MSDLVSRLQVEGPQVWRQLSWFQRATLAAVGLAAAGAIVFLAQWAQQPEYSAVYTKLSDTDAAAAVSKLKELKIPYKLADGGSTVRVPSDKVYDARLELASQGVPKGGTVGFELFDKVSFGLTDFAQKLNYQRGLEGELARTIGRLSGVEEARVHIVLPTNELFADKDKPATASVLLRMKPGAGLDSRQVKGIVNLVSASVEGLKPDNVAVLDGDGVPLSGQDAGAVAGTGRSSEQRDAQRSYERSLQADIQAMLDRVLGPGKAVARVSAVLSWDQYESNSEVYSPSGNQPQARSSRETVERSALPLGEATLAGVPSYPIDARAPTGRVSPEPTKPADSATPAATPQPSPDAASAEVRAVPTAEPKYEKRDVTTNYEISRMVERTVRAPGTVQRLSVAVVLDGAVNEAAASTISKTVSAAVGLNPARGDSIVVSSLPFDRTTSTAAEQAGQEVANRQLYFEAAKAGLAVISLLVIALLVRSLIKGLTREHHPAQPVARTIREVRQSIPATSSHLPVEEKLPLLTQRELMELAGTQPKLLAQIVKSWIDEK